MVVEVEAIAGDSGNSANIGVRRLSAGVVSTWARMGDGFGGLFIYSGREIGRAHV